MHPIFFPFMGDTVEKPPTSICIVRLSALGDVVMVLPLIKMLRREWPLAKITWIIGRGALPLVAHLENQGVEFIAIEKPRKLSDYLALRRQLSGRIFDALLCLQASWRANLIYPCIRARRKIGYDKQRANDLHSLFIRETIPPPSPDLPHIVDGFLQFAEKLGGTRNDADVAGKWDLAVDTAAQDWATRTLPAKRWLAISPCASKTERDWQPEAYAQVAAHAIRAHGLNVVLLGGPALKERQMADEILSTPGLEDSVDLVGKIAIPQLVAALQRCTVLLAPDTGSVHIARALARPVVGLYAVAPSCRTGAYRRTEYSIDKYSQASRLVHGEGSKKNQSGARAHGVRAMRLIPVHEVCEALDKALYENPNIIDFTD